MRALCALIVLASVIATSAYADWFTRLDSAGRLVVTGIAVDENRLLSAVTLSCSDGELYAEITTTHNAREDDRQYYFGTKVIFTYKTRDGEIRKLGLDGTPLIQPGNVLAITAKLTNEQSRAIYTSIGVGNRLDVELIHPNLIYETGVKTVYSSGFPQALQGMYHYCPGLDDK